MKFALHEVHPYLMGSSPLIDKEFKVLYTRAGQTNAAGAADTVNDAWLDEICACMGARYHDPELYESDGHQD